MAGCVAVLALLAPAVSHADARALGAAESLAQQTVTALGKVPATAVVVAAPLVSDQAAPKGDELAVKIAALMAGRIGSTARASGQTAQLGTGRALAGKAGGLVYVQVEIAKGELRATADVYPAQANAWDRIRNPTPSPIAHAFAARKIDAEVRAYLTPILLEQASIHKASYADDDVLAVACGDVDGDGGNEIALVSRARVAMGRVRGGKFVAERVAPWAQLAPRGPAPLREVIGGAAFAPSLAGDGTSALFVGTTDRSGVMLTSDFGAHLPLSSVPLTFGIGAAGDGVGCATANPTVGAFEGLLLDCAPERAKSPLLTPPAPRYDAFAATRVVTRDGTSRPLFAARAPDGRVYLRLGAEDDTSATLATLPASSALDGVGAQIAAGDLDQDGHAEIVTTRNAAAADDAITIWSFRSATPVLRRTIPAPGGVRALAVCPAEDKGAPALVAVVGDELWIVR